MIIKVKYWSFVKTLWVRRRSRNVEFLLRKIFEYCTINGHGGHLGPVA